MMQNLRDAQVVLSNFRLSTLDFYIQFYNDIPSKPGVYSWSFWPFREFHVNDSNFDELVRIVKKFGEINLNQPENANTGYKFSVSVVEQGLNNNMLGLSEKKFELLIRYLQRSENNRKYFLDFFKKIILNKPFYVGKADNLNERLRQHFNRNNSDLLNQLENRKINFSDILINFEVIEEHLESNINSVFEEITQRILKPALTKRPG